MTPEQRRQEMIEAIEKSPWKVKTAAKRAKVIQEDGTHGIDPETLKRYLNGTSQTMLMLNYDAVMDGL